MSKAVIIETKPYVMRTLIFQETEISGSEKESQLHTNAILISHYDVLEPFPFGDASFHSRVSILEPAGEIMSTIPREEP